MKNFQEDYNTFLIQEIQKKTSIQSRLNVHINLIHQEMNIYNQLNKSNNKYAKLSKPITVESLIKEDIHLFYELLLKNNSSLTTIKWFRDILKNFLSDENHYQEFLTNFEKIGFHFYYSDFPNFLESFEAYEIVPENKKIDFLKNYKISHKNNSKDIDNIIFMMEKAFQKIDEKDKSLVMKNFLLNYENDCKKVTKINKLDKILQKNFTQNEIKDFYQVLGLEYEEELFDNDADLILNILIEKDKLANKLKIESVYLLNIFRNIESLFSDKKIKGKLNLELIKFQELKGKKYFFIIILKKDNGYNDLMYKSVLKDLILYCTEHKMLSYGKKIESNIVEMMIEKSILNYSLPEKEEKKKQLKI
jgi:hypothetical protein